MHKERIQLGDSVHDMVIKMSDGVPGAVIVLADMIKEGAKIDPDDFLCGMGAVLGLDSHGIYGSRIWMLFKDVCHESTVNMLAVLRACQLGIISPMKLSAAIDGDGTLDVSTLLSKVQEELPDFAKGMVVV